MTTPVAKTVHVRVPATSANLGPAFDCAGLALEYFDDVEFRVSQDSLNTVAQVFIEGEGADSLPRDERHLVVSTFRRACHEFGLGQLGFMMECTNRIPQARGMGSSAEAIVVGVAAAAAFAYDGPLDRDEIFALAAEIEGHPDNVAPAVYGGLTASWKVKNRFQSVRYAVDRRMTSSVFIPDFEVSTAAAREALPETVSFADAVFNESRAMLLPAALNPVALSMPEAQWMEENEQLAAMNTLLCEATEDTLHERYRMPLMEPSADLVRKLRAQGFAAMISGAGPCVIVLHAGDASRYIDAAAVDELHGGHWRVLHLPVNHTGVQVQRS